MIDKKEAESLSVKTVDSGRALSPAKDELIEKLKELMPGLVNSDNMIDIRALGDLIDIAGTTSNNQGYELTFAGKGLARALADEPTGRELKVELKQSKSFDSTGNVIIRGDNIDALKNLYQNYHSKIKMIYIDPPYNTKSEDFVYNDNFKQSEAKLIEEFGLGEETVDFLDNVYGTRSHSGWLAFMYPRLKLARELLRDDGVIFISIDDNEQANLKIMCDEIFGEDNFVANVIWQRVFSPKNDSKYFSDNHDYIAVYAKNITSVNVGRLERSEESRERYSNPDNDPRGDWMSSDLTVKTYSEKYDYPITTPGGRDVKPTQGRCWNMPKDKMLDLISDNRVWFGADGNNTPRLKRFFSEVQQGIVPVTLWLHQDVGHNQEGRQELKKLFDDQGTFDGPKPVRLIKRIISLSTSAPSASPRETSPDIILDFFAGSGTTAHAVMQLNAEDGGNRKFILVQWDEEIAKDKPAFKFCTDNKLDPVISSICIERVNRAGEKIKKELAEKEGMFPRETPLDIGYKVFSLTDKTRVKYNNDEELFKVEGRRASHLDTLYNMMAAVCMPLDTPVDEIKKKVIYKAGNEIFLLGNVTKEEMDSFKDLKVNIDAFADFDLQGFLNLGVSDRDNVGVVW